MNGLLLKDIKITLRNLSFFYLLPVLVLIFVGIFNFQSVELTFVLVATTVPMVLSFQVSSTFFLDDGVKWDRMVAVMPLSIKEEVGSKYLLALLWSIIALIITATLCSILALVFSGSLHLAFYSSFAGLLLGLLYNAVIMPIIFRFGVTKSRYVFIATIYGIALVPVVASFLGFNFDLTTLMNTSYIEYYGIALVM